MKYLKKAIPLCLLALILIITITLIAPKTEAATVSSGTCGDNLTWTLDDTGTLTISGSGEMWSFNDDDPDVDYHENPWKELKPNIKKVIFNSGVTSIGEAAFLKCEQLTQVTFADSIISIGHFSFKRCTNLENFVFPQKLQSLGQECFSGCPKMTKVRIPDTVTYLGGHIFDGCSALSEVYIGGCTDVFSYVYANNPLGECSSLEVIQVSPDNVALSAVDGVLYNKEGTMLVQYPIAKKDKVYTVPEGVVTISQGAMEDHPYIEEIYFPESLEKIDNLAFNRCKNLREVHFAASQSLTTIGTWAFEFCDSLTSMNIPYGVTSIGQGAFYGCSSLSSVNIPNSVTSIDSFAFYDCSSLANVHYGGSQTQWNAISIGSNNISLTNAKIVFTDEPGVLVGDVSSDGRLSNDDVLTLLWHTLFPEENPVGVPVDFNRDSKIDNNDVLLLLWHTLFPEQNPL